MQNAVVSYWLRKLEKEGKAHGDFRTQAADAYDAYFDEEKSGRKNLYPLFWSNVSLLHGAIYSATPAPDVRKRYEDPQQAPPQGQQGQPGQTVAISPHKAIATCLERSIEYILDTEDFNGHADRMVDDYLIAGMGTPWVEYDAKVSPDSEGSVEIALQTMRMVHVAWSRFHWEPCKDWEDCDWIARDHYLSRKEVKQQFNVEPEGDGTRPDGEKMKSDKYETQYLVHEIFYRPTRTVYVLGEAFDTPLEVRPDKLNLAGFYPCPKPLFANLKSKELIPKPDYCFYKEQCDYINRITQRIHNITRQIKDVGFYDAQLSELAQLTTAEDGTMVPIAALAERLALSGGGWEAVVAKLPIADKVAVIQALLNLRDQAEKKVDQINGISDILRGSSDPRETKGAQQLKGQYANLRIARRQKAVDRVLRDVFRLFAEIISEHFTPEQIYLMSGVQVTPEMQAIMKSDVGRTFAIDVESDSTVAADDNADKANTLEMLQTLTGYANQMLPAIQQGVMPADLGKEIMLLAAGSFKSGKNLEDAINALPGNAQQMAQLTQAAQQAQQQVAQLTKQLQEVQQQLGQVDQQEQARKNAATQADMQGKQAEAGKDMTTANLNQARTITEHQKAAQAAQMGQVLPFP